MSELLAEAQSQGFGRFKKRALLACLGEAARKLTILCLLPVSFKAVSCLHGTVCVVDTVIFGITKGQRRSREFAARHEQRLACYPIPMLGQSFAGKLRVSGCMPCTNRVESCARSGHPASDRIGS